MADENAGQKPYNIIYNVKAFPNGLSKISAKKRAEEVGGGACQAILIASLLYPPDGSFSCLFVSMDGRTESDVPDLEWFKVWTMMAKRLSESETLSTNKKELCATLWGIIRDSVVAASKKDA